MSIPLLPYQDYFLDLSLKSIDSWCILTPMLVSPRRLSASRMEDCLRSAERRYQALRMRVRDGIVIDSRSDRNALLKEFSMGNYDSLAAIVSEVQDLISLEHGPVLVVALVHEGLGSRMFAVAHHFVTDAFGMRLGMGRLMQQYLEPTSAEAEEFSTRYAVIADGLSASATRFASELPYWLDQTRYSDGFSSSAPTPVAQKDLVSSVMELACPLGDHWFDAAFLSAIALVGSRRSGSDGLRIGTARLGRPVPETRGSTTEVGWFASFFPLAIPVVTTKAQIEVVQEMLRGIPSAGHGYLWLVSHGGTEADRLREVRHPDVYYNNTGRMKAGGSGGSYHGLDVLPLPNVNTRFAEETFNYVVSFVASAVGKNRHTIQVSANPTAFGGGQLATIVEDIKVTFNALVQVT